MCLNCLKIYSLKIIVIESTNNQFQKNFILYTSNQYQDWRREANWVKDAIAIESSETKRENYILCKYINRNF